MKRKNFKHTTQLLVIIGILMMTACGGKETGEEVISSTNQSNNSSCKKLSPEQAGEQVVAIYRKAMKETVDLLKNKPDAASVEKTFNTSLENYQNQLLKIGQHVMTMNSQQNGVVESAINKEHMNMQINKEAKELFADFSKLIFEYRNHKELYTNLKSINIITQFAFFDLLKKQNQNAEQKWGDMMKPTSCK